MSRYEAHLTFDRKHATAVEEMSHGTRWVYSVITGCPILGQGTYCYLTSFGRRSSGSCSTPRRASTNWSRRVPHMATRRKYRIVHGALRDGFGRLTEYFWIERWTSTNRRWRPVLWNRASSHYVYRSSRSLLSHALTTLMDAREKLQLIMLEDDPRVALEQQGRVVNERVAHDHEQDAFRALVIEK